jgi:hypothetical protein
MISAERTVVSFILASCWALRPGHEFGYIRATLMAG